MQTSGCSAIEDVDIATCHHWPEIIQLARQVQLNQRWQTISMLTLIPRRELPPLNDNCRLGVLTEQPRATTGNRCSRWVGRCIVLQDVDMTMCYHWPEKM